ncbi:MAG: 3-methylmercaptopropionyl-CoA dehydrogenase [Burkholderia gladioli]|nr:MAG: 3-methylmercaptopropionyl-CoA dehydrogenase [Burkholderia gladioli]
MSYIAPVKDMLFVMKELAGIDDVAKLPGFEDAGFDTAQAVLDESAKFCGEVLAPLNVEGDRQPSTWRQGAVTATTGFGDAFRQFVAGGWQGLQHPVEYDGQGLPKLIATPCIEMLNASNLSFALCPLLTDGAIEALLTAGSDEQKSRYVPKLISGEWTGTMNLTEPQAGSDLPLPFAGPIYRHLLTLRFVDRGTGATAYQVTAAARDRQPDALAAMPLLGRSALAKLPFDDAWLGREDAARSGGRAARRGVGETGAATAPQAGAAQ